MALTEPTPKDTVLRDGTAQLYHFHHDQRPTAKQRLPVLLVPSMLNRWYVLDLREGASLVEALREDGFDVWCMDWGVARDEDRYMTWEQVVARLGRVVRKVRRETGVQKIGMLGYCMGATLSGIYAALHPEHVAAFVNLAGPFDFSQVGFMGEVTRRQWFDVTAITSAGNVTSLQMHSGFTAMRPTGQLAKWVKLVDRCREPDYVDAFGALETWVNDNIPFPAAAYTTYIGELYQENLLIKGAHYVRGERVDLGKIDCPVLSVVAERDTICPPAAAMALNDKCGATDKEVVTVPGGHVGSVVGSRAPRLTYPAISAWLKVRLDTSANADGQTSLVPVTPEGPKPAKATPRRSTRTRKAAPAKAAPTKAEVIEAAPAKAEVIEAEAAAPEAVQVKASEVAKANPDQAEPKAEAAQEAKPAARKTTARKTAARKTTAKKTAASKAAAPKAAAKPRSTRSRTRRSKASAGEASAAPAQAAPEAAAAPKKADTEAEETP